MAKKPTYPKKLINRALGEYLDTGSFKLVAQAIDVPWSTVRRWAKEGDWETLLARVQAEVEARLAQASIQRQTDVRALALDIQLLSLQKLHTQMSTGEIVKGFAAVAESMGRILNATPAGDDSKGESYEDAVLRAAGMDDGE